MWLSTACVCLCVWVHVSVVFGVSCVFMNVDLCTQVYLWVYGCTHKARQWDRSAVMPQGYRN